MDPTLRLVCYKWSIPAEIAMFGKKITIKSEEQAIMLHACLFKTPSKGRLIKHLDFSISTNQLPVIYHYLLDLAFTPTIEQLTGFVQAEEFFTALGDIADDTIEEFKNLRALPKGPNQTVVLKASIRLNVCSLTIGNDFPVSNAPMLEKLSSLTELEISYYKKDWKELETILKYCPDLMVLRFAYLELPYEFSSSVDVSTWLAATVTKQMNLETLEFHKSTVGAGVAEYLRYKYPNIKTTKCDGYNANGFRYNRAANCIHRVLDAMRDMHADQATLVLFDQSSLRWSVEFAAARKEDIKFQIDKNGELIMKVKFGQKEI
ncbi:hypothetical protein MBANPS3_003084 [Mucor bainieri]